MLLAVGAVVVAGSVWLFYEVRAESGRQGWAGPLLAVGAFVVGLAQVATSALMLRPDGGRVSPAAAGTTGPRPDRPGMTSLDPPQLAGIYARGRDRLVRQLSGVHSWQLRRVPRVRVLHGMGGAGKTTIAQAAAERLQASGVLVWWISAATETDLHTGMRQLASRLGATDGRGWLRPVRTRRGAVLVTTRDGDPTTWPTGPDSANAWYHLHPVGMLTLADGARVLLDRAGAQAGSVEAAGELAVRLGGLPLALSLVGHYLAEARQLPLPGVITTFTDYRAALETVGAPTIFGSLTEAQARRLIDRTWELSLDLLAERGLPRARTLLRLLSLLADAPVPYRLIDAAVLAGSPLFQGIEASELRGLLRALAGMGLIDADPTDSPEAVPALRIHPLIRDVSRHHVQAGGQLAEYLQLAIGLADVAAATDHHDPANWPTWQALAPHILHLVTWTAGLPEAASIAFEPVARSGRAASNYLGAAGLYSTARDQAGTVHSVCRRLLGPQHPETLRLQANWANWTGVSNDPAAARDQFLALLPIQERICGVDDPATLDARFGVARWTGQAGDAAAARDQFAALLTVLERVLGVDDPTTLAGRYALARWTGEAGDPAAARDQLTELIPIWERVLGNEDHRTLMARFELARCTGEAGDHPAARKQLTELLPICERVLGTDYVDTRKVRDQLARWTA